MEDLARAFNDMVGRLQEVYSDLARQVNERSRQLVRSERLASRRLPRRRASPTRSTTRWRASPSAARRWRPASSRCRATCKVGNRACEEQEIFAKYLKMIQEEAFRCKNITERLLEFSRTGEPRRDPTDLRGLIQAVLDVTQHLTNHKAKQIQLEVPPDRAGPDQRLGQRRGDQVGRPQPRRQRAGEHGRRRPADDPPAASATGGPSCGSPTPAAA